jgi:uncharacterized repeat protein (TIGR03803 family)
MKSGGIVKTKRFPQLCGAGLALAAISFGLAVRAHAQTESVVYPFLGGSDGQYPVDSLAVDSAGNLYGTTSSGGYNPCLGIGCGAAWVLSPTAGGWAFTSIHVFFGGRDGAQPLAGFILDAAGNLYGTTGLGGNDHACVALGPGCGAVIEFSHTANGWTEKTLATFNGPNTGWYPLANLTLDAAGNLYGTTEYGGSSDYCNGDTGGCGIVFRLSPKSGGGWSETVLHVFHSSPHGAAGYLPFSGVTVDAGGNLYGTTLNGGSSTPCPGFGCGVVYKLTPTATGPWKETVLHAFADGPDGAYPWGGVILDSKGNLYGTAQQGGDLTACSAHGCGTVFELSPRSNGTWHFQVLHTFEGADGGTPAAGLIFDSQGNLLGTTQLGGDLACNNRNGCGTVFRLSPSSAGWHETVLHAFSGYPDGSQPFATVTEDTSGNIFGTTQYGGLTTLCCGTVFEIKP